MMLPLGPAEARRVGAAAMLPVLLALVLAGCGDGAGAAPGTPAGPVLAPERVRAVVESYVAAFNTRDRALYVSLFADDGTVEDPAGAAPVTGRDALAAFFDAATASGGLTLTVPPDGIRVSGNHVAFAFQLRLANGGRVLGMPVIDTFELDPDGRIRAMRAYWHPEDFRVLAD